MAKQDLTQALSGVIQDKKENNLQTPKPIKKEPKPTPKKIETTRLDDEIVGSVRVESVTNYALRLPKDFYKALKLYCDQKDTSVNTLIYNKLRDVLENDQDFKEAYKFINK